VPDAQTNRFRTKLLAPLGAIALIVIGAVVTPLGSKLVDLVWPAPQSKLDASLVNGEGCKVGGPAIAVTLSYAFTGSTWWATADALPASVLDDLRHDTTYQPDVVLAKYSPVQSQYGAGTLLKLIVLGCGPKPVVITNLRPIITKRDKPLSGSVAWRPPQGNLDVTSIGFDLDGTEPTALEYDSSLKARLGGSYFATKAVRVAPDETVPFSVMALTRTSYLEWSIRFETLVDGKAWNFTVSMPDGQPIRSTAVAQTYQSAYVDNVVSGWATADGTKTANTLRLK
jgi:hypothetical protein